VSQWYTPFELVELPEERREFTELGRFSSVSDAELNTQGLPSWLSRVVVDGIPFAPARNPDLAIGRLGGAAFPLSSFSAAELVTNGLDVEWSGAAGGFLSGHTQRGTRESEIRAYGDWSGGAVT
jgi:hypothetical protein